MRLDRNKHLKNVPGDFGCEHELFRRMHDLKTEIRKVVEK